MHVETQAGNSDLLPVRQRNTIDFITYTWRLINSHIPLPMNDNGTDVPASF